MKKVLFVVESLAGGGAEKVLLTLVKNLDKTKYDVTVFTVVKTGVYVEKMEKQCTLLYALPEYTKLNWFGKLMYRIKNKVIYTFDTKKVYKWLIKDKYDIEVGFVEGFSTKLVASSSNEISKKYAWVHTDMIANNHADSRYKSIEEQKNAYAKFIQIFAVSNSVKERFVEKFGIRSVSVQYNPVDSYEIQSKAMLISKNQLPFKPNMINMISVGRLEKQKGYDRLLKIVKELSKDYHNFHIYILGEGSKHENLQNNILENNITNFVTLLGFKNNPYPYIANSDCFICSSRSEGFSTVATEAIILGKPVITTDCSGMRELFGEYNCGIITKNESQDLLKGIKKVLDDPEILNSYHKAIEERQKFFSIENRMREIEAIFDV